MSGLKLCPTCGSDHTIPVVDCQTGKTLGFTCEWCGQDWTPLPDVEASTSDGNVIRLPGRDPIRGGQVQ